MDVLANLALGFQTAMSLSNLLYCLVGVFLGTAVGVLPGIGPIATIAMLLPITFGLPPVSALIMLSGIYYGAQYGGSTTAILINLPGESASVVTALDGHRMARQGKAGLALATAAIGSFIAGTAATLLVALFAPPLAEVALQFGPAEYFSLMVLGLVASIVLASGSLLHALAVVVVGLVLGLVGTDVNSGVSRYSLGFPQLADGVGFVVIAMGMFGLAEIISNLEHEGTRGAAITRVKGLLPSREDWEKSSALSRGARFSAPPWAFCRAAARYWRRLHLIRSKRSFRRRRKNSDKAPLKAWPAPKPPTMPERRHHSFRC